MDWFFSLVNSLCPFCERVLARPNQACPLCASEMAAIEVGGAIHAELSCGVEPGSPRLPVKAGANYEGWVRDTILRQKRGSKSQTVIGWLSDLVVQTMPEEWHELELLWLPGAPLGEIHLVEWLALELSKRGLKLYPRSALERRLWPSKPQKALKMKDRRERDMRQTYLVPGGIKGKQSDSNSGPVILLDDVITTGGTITGCRKIVEEDLGLKVAGALAIAYTPRRVSLERALERANDQ